MTGTVRARPVTYRLEAEWVLQHRFVELHMEDVEHTPPRYEARVFGAAYSVPSATGTATGDSLTLDFPIRTVHSTTRSYTIPRRIRGRSGWMRRTGQIAGSASRTIGRFVGEAGAHAPRATPERLNDPAELTAAPGSV
jgi:hypothetical protein